MTKAAIFDIDGTLVDAVDLHASAWQDAFAQFGHDVSFEQARSQIGEGGDQRLPVFLSPAQPRIVATIWKRGAAIDSKKGICHGPPIFGSARIIATCSRRRPEYSSRVVGQKEELAMYLDISRISYLVDVSTSSSDAEKSKPAPDIFNAALKKLAIDPADAVATGDTPYDAQAAGKRACKPSACCVVVLRKTVSAMVAVWPSTRDLVHYWRLLQCVATRGRAVRRPMRTSADGSQRLPMCAVTQQRASVQPCCSMLNERHFCHCRLKCLCWRRPTIAGCCPVRACSIRWRSMTRCWSSPHESAT